MPCIYLLLFLIYSYDFYTNKKDYAFAKRLLLIASVSVHFIFIILRTYEFSHAPITNKFELFSSIAFTITLAYFLVEIVTNVRSTGFFIIFIALVFQLTSSIFVYNQYIVKDVLRNPLLGIHVISALLGHSSLTLSAVYGILFLILYKKIKTHNYGNIFNKLPNLEMLEKMSFYSVVIGYIILTFSIIIGGIWLPIAFPDFKHYDPKLLSSILIWLVYTCGIAVKILFKWYGRKVVYFSLIGFVVLIISMLIPIVFSSSFHNFR